MAEMTTNEQMHADAETAIAEQTPVKVKLSLLVLPDGSRYLDITTKTDKATILAMVDLSRRIIKASDPKTAAWHRASLCYENARELAYVYELMERPVKEPIEPNDD